MRLRRTSGVRPMASRMLLQRIWTLSLTRRLKQAGSPATSASTGSTKVRKYKSTSLGRAVGDKNRRGANSNGAEEHFERNQVGAECGVFASGAGGKHD